jgi:predicted enzyme related to lactoylglutathione lyase
VQVAPGSGRAPGAVLAAFSIPGRFDRVPRMKGAVMLQSSPMYAYLPARDVARARQFYEQKVGLKPAKQEVAGGVVYAFGGGTACFLYQTDNAGTSKASQAFWQVADVEREVADLKSRGVVFEDYDMPGDKSPSGVITAGGAKTAWFKDTEGNILAIVQDVN